MGVEIDADTRWRAMELYCADRLTFAQVSEATGIADSTLRRWADAYQWRERREELARAEADAAEETKTILAEAEQRCQALKQNARTRLNQAAKRIVEGVVKG